MKIVEEMQEIVNEFEATNALSIIETAPLIKRIVAMILTICSKSSARHKLKYFACPHR